MRGLVAYKVLEGKGLRTNRRFFNSKAAIRIIYLLLLRLKRINRKNYCEIGSLGNQFAAISKFQKKNGDHDIE